MYSLIGFIHVLLMLTSTRFVPDFGFLSVDEIAATKVAIGSSLQNTFQLPVEDGPRLSFECVRSSDKEKLKPVLRTEGRYFLQVQKIKQLNRAVFGNKRYLLLGQLKTEG
jgi:hypothetical protein